MKAKILPGTSARHSSQVAWTRVDIKTDARNEVARGAIAALGATFEGILRAWQPSLAPGEEGRTRDTAMFAITPQQWPGVRTRLVERIERRSTSSKG